MIGVQSLIDPDAMPAASCIDVAACIQLVIPKLPQLWSELAGPHFPRTRDPASDDVAREHAKRNLAGATTRTPRCRSMWYLVAIDTWDEGRGDLLWRNTLTASGYGQPTMTAVSNPMSAVLCSSVERF